MRRNKKSIITSLIMFACLFLLTITSRYAGGVVLTSAKPTATGQVIILDAGHGGIDGGAYANGVTEKEINLAITLNLADMLRLSGFEVVLTRTDDNSIHDESIQGIAAQKKSDMNNRLKIIQSYDNPILLSIHQNKYISSKYYGAQIFYNPNNDENQILAEYMRLSFKKLQPDNDREIKQSSDELFLFRNTKTPAILIECGFLSNPEEAQMLTEEEYQKKVAFVIYAGLVDYLSNPERINYEEVE